ncbi:hypothetical protein JR316_0012155, partial [Psilocybe cubensis]
LFPRRHDGKVVLPNPAQIQKEDPIVQISRSTSHMMLDGESTSHTIQQRTLPHKHSINEGSSSSRPKGGEGGLQRPHPTSSTRLNSSTSAKSVDNYAQLSSLPEFKAFKLNKEGQPETRETASSSPGSSTSKDGTPEPQEWMREVKVSRRTKKQSYVRSGGEDFCIRLYTGQEKH